MNDTPIKTVMTSSLVTANGEFTLYQIAQLFKENNFHHLPIVNNNGDLLGIISSTDIERVTVGATLFKHPNREEYTEAVFHTMRAKDLMTEEIVILKPADTIYKAYQLFKENKFRALPVVDHGSLEGIVTPLDLLTYFFNEK